MGKNSGTSTATNTSEPWAEQKPYLTEGFKEAQSLWKQPGPTFYPGSTVAGFAPEQQQAYLLGADRARQGNQTVNAAESYAGDVLGGKYLASDPNQDAVFQNIKSNVMPTVNSQFMEAGRYGSGLHGDMMTRALTESYAPYASQNYQAGLSRMDQMAGMAPEFAAQDYTDLQALEGIGGQRQSLAQQELDDAVSRHSYYQDLPANKLGQYMAMIGGNFGGTTTSTTPYHKPSIWSQVAGGGLGLLGLLG